MANIAPGSMPVLGVSDFVALVNQTLEFAYPGVTIVGELANFRVSKNKWVYFDLKDELASVRFFGTVYQLPGPLEDGLMLEVRGQPRLHPEYGFSVTVAALKPVGEGSLKRAASLLEAKLRSEGLFDEVRKRSLPYPPTHIGLITSSEAAAYSDFMKVLQARWGGLVIDFIDVQVQGETASPQIIRALAQLNAMACPPEVLVITRGGGSAEDLQAFNNEELVRAIAASRVPTLVAIGHERDISLAELAADVRGSTPSNAAEIVVPSRQQELSLLAARQRQLALYLRQQLTFAKDTLRSQAQLLGGVLQRTFEQTRQYLEVQQKLLEALSPQAILERGYSIVRKGSLAIKNGRDLAPGDIVSIELANANLAARLTNIRLKS